MFNTIIFNKMRKMLLEMKKNIPSKIRYYNYETLRVKNCFC